jgi:cyclic pyranopterin phosphate synthase
MEEEEEGEEERRPRLHALRQRLRDDHDHGKTPLDFMKRFPRITTTTTTTQQQQQQRTLPPKTIMPPLSLKPPPERSVHEILQQLRQQQNEHDSLLLLANNKKTDPTTTNNNSSNSSILTDSFHRRHTYLRLSLAERCNLRCRYCMPPEGVPLQESSQLLSRSELVHLTSLFRQHGVDKIRLTGGEPLLRRDLVDIVRDLSSSQPQQQSSLQQSLQALPPLQQIGMTTNGVTLERVLVPLIDAGLTHVNISLDTLKADVFQHLTRRPGLDRVLSSIRAAIQSLPLHQVKINCVVMKDVNDVELQDFVMLGQELNVDVRFIEWMPFNNNGWNQNRFVSHDSMKANISTPLVPIPSDNPNDTTRWYTVKEDNDHFSSTSAAGRPRVGFITSMSQHFCGTCNRLRLTADGKIKACLFGTTEFSLRDVLRDPDCTNEDLERIIAYAVQQKAHSLGGHGSAQGISNQSHHNRPMTLIGG